VNLKTLRTRRISRDFYERDALSVAPELIGTHVVHVDPSGTHRVARVVETEAYRGPHDAACHARFGMTKRTRTLFGPPGCAYVFLIYGMYDCLNAVCMAEGAGHAVLVRAVEPLFGIAPKLRGDGPGRLTRTLGITRAHDGIDFAKSEVLFFAHAPESSVIAVTPRVGVAYAGAIADEPWRFLDASSAHTSRPSWRLVGRGLAPTSRPVTLAERGRTRA
jgi:DNA-3-methyladenine glycosylase